MVLKQLFNLNHFVAYTVVIFLASLSWLHDVPGPGYLIPPLLAVLLVYIFRLVPYLPRPGRKLGFYAGHFVIALANGAIILSIALPVLWSSLANDEDLLMLLWLTIPAVIVALPGWLIGALLVWICGTRRPAPGPLRPGEVSPG